MTKRPAITARPCKTLAEIREIIKENRAAGHGDVYRGLTSSEIGEDSRALMFGENGEAFPGEAEWSLWTD